eukprot:TRINITY_DN11555_c0_g1_i1.p2 TRINITY_DN11555_c0_g1~~TRINITY_DN11555_c0_g1_i1.p2  ORF type:complete len:105 (-),score=7.22 TRINITY_DN11555_c0_g1_i1:118-432(-)
MGTPATNSAGGTPLLLFVGLFRGFTRWPHASIPCHSRFSRASLLQNLQLGISFLPNCLISVLNVPWWLFSLMSLILLRAIDSASLTFLGVLVLIQSLYLSLIHI